MLLLIHPDQKLTQIYHRHLSKYLNVDSAHDGLMGLRKIKTHKPKIIVSDFNLPFMSGLALLKYVRNDRELFKTPFIFLSNSEMPYEALDLGANAWLTLSEHGPESLIHKIAIHI